MIALDFDMILTSLILSVILGAVGAVTYSLLKLFVIGFSVLCISDVKRRKGIFNISIQFVDFFFVISVAFAQMLIAYVACDGVFSFYSLIVTVTAFYITSFFIQRLSRWLFTKLKARPTRGRAK